MLIKICSKWLGVCFNLAFKAMSALMINDLVDGIVLACSYHGVTCSPVHDLCSCTNNKFTFPFHTFLYVIVFPFSTNLLCFVVSCIQMGKGQKVL